MDLASSVWSGIQKNIKTEISEVPYTLWFGSANAINLTESSVTLVAENEFKKNVIINRYNTLVENEFEKALGFKVIIHYTSKESSNQEEENIFNEFEPIHTVREEQNADLKNEILAENVVTDQYSFDNFVVGNSNIVAQRSCYAVATDPVIKINPLFLYGPSGLGKTHLLFAIINEVKKRNPRFNALYVTGEQFTNELIESIIPDQSRKSDSKYSDNRKKTEFREKFRNVDMLLVDDVQFISGKFSIQEEFFHTFDTLYKMEKQIILTSDKSPKDISLLEERLRTRFEMGLITDIQPPDVEMRIAIIKQKVAALKIDIPNDVLTYLSENIKNNVRQIEGALKKLWAHSFITGEKINLEMAKKVLSDYFKENEKTKITPEVIFDYITKRYGISIDDLIGKKRNAEIVYVRHIAIYLTNELTDLSLKKIGLKFGKDHTTIISARDNVIRRMKSDAAFNKEIKDIINELQEN